MSYSGSTIATSSPSTPSPVMTTDIKDVASTRPRARKKWMAIATARRQHCQLAEREEEQGHGGGSLNSISGMKMTDRANVVSGAALLLPTVVAGGAPPIPFAATPEAVEQVAGWTRSLTSLFSDIFAPTQSSGTRQKHVQQQQQQQRHQQPQNRLQQAPALVPRVDTVITTTAATTTTTSSVSTSSRTVQNQQQHEVQRAVQAVVLSSNKGNFGNIFEFADNSSPTSSRNRNSNKGKRVRFHHPISSSPSSSLSFSPSPPPSPSLLFLPHQLALCPYSVNNILDTHASDPANNPNLNITMSSANDTNVPTNTSSSTSSRPATPPLLTRSSTHTDLSNSEPRSTSLSRSMTERILPPTSGSALLQFVAAALRSEGLGGLVQRSEAGEEDDDMVHVKNVSSSDRRPSLISKMSMHALGIHSDNEADTSDGSSSEDEEEEGQSPHRLHPQREKSHHRAKSEAGDMSKSESAISFGSFRDKKSIAEKLQAAFGYSEAEDFLGEYSCWLARSVLLPGYMYLTTNHICFYANLPSSQDIVQKEGFFSKKSRTTKKYYRYWFVLKNDFLSCYSNQTDVYYPIKTIDLKHALSAEPSPTNEETFHIFTNNKKYTFKTDSSIQRTDWVKAIQKSIFHAKMEGDKVKISIPVGNVVDVEMNTMAFAEAIQIKVMESDESFAVDEYYFAYFNDTPKTLAALKDQVRDYQSRHGKDSPHYQKIYDSTSPHATSPRKITVTTVTNKAEASHQLPSISSGLSASRSLLQSPRRLLHPEYAASKSHSRSSSPDPRSQPTSDTEDSEKDKRHSSLSFSIRGTTSWIQEHTSDFFSSDDNVPLTEKEQANFRQEFGLPDSEGLGAVVSGYLLRVLPLYGRIYLSDNYICYKSRLYGTRTKVIVPLSDISEVDRHKGTRFYFHGMSILTKIDEEIFFEFSTVEARNTILNTLRDRISPEAQEKRLKQRARNLLETPSAELDDPMEARVMESLQLQEEPVHVEPWATQPCFKPSRPLHITCLTIGSRGDVQPYIALCKRLMQDGHTCRISTHAEYKDWIEGHGIEFGLVGGDPGELIELCVENGMFTVSFIREGLKRFRGWLDDLMVTAWKSCQNTDVLIESPSAMAGIHIAERLDIPYFRAFPFPWTRTRAFPHPFAVPEHKLGRGYNYMTYVMIEQVFWKGIAGQINRWRRDTLGLPPTSQEKMEAHRVPFLYSWSPNVLPAPIDWHAWIHVTGYWFLDNPDHNWNPPQDLLDFLKADPNNKPVYIGFGSMVVADPDGMTRTIIEAVAKSGVRAIISKGWSDRVTPHQEGQAPTVKKESEKIVIPDSIYMIKSVPHDWLFPQLSGVVHHGGAGTAAAGLRAGVPTVIKPFFGDQYFWAQRVEEAGVGVWCHDLTVKKLTSALVTITTDEKMIKRAQMMGEKIRAEDGVGKAVQYFYHDLGEAKQRLNKLRRDKAEDTPLKFKVQEGEDDWWFVQPSKSGATSGDGSESTVGLNVFSGSDEESSITPTPTEDRRGAFSAGGLQYARSSNGVELTNTEPEVPYVDHAQSEPVPDRGEEILNANDESAEAVAARLEAMRPPRQESPGPFLNASPMAFAEGESSAHVPHHQHSESTSFTKSSSGKRASTARRVIDSITSKASHVTGYFSPSMSSTSSQPQPSPPPLSLPPQGSSATATSASSPATSSTAQQQKQPGEIESHSRESSASSALRLQIPSFGTKSLR